MSVKPHSQLHETKNSHGITGGKTFANHQATRPPVSMHHEAALLPVLGSEEKRQKAAGLLFQWRMPVTEGPGDLWAETAYQPDSSRKTASSLSEAFLHYHRRTTAGWQRRPARSITAGFLYLRRGCNFPDITAALRRSGIRTRKKEKPPCRENDTEKDKGSQGQ